MEDITTQPIEEVSKPALDPRTSMDGKYVVLMETSGEEFESWYYFIKMEGNEENLGHLQRQLEDVEWYILDEYNTFDLDLEHHVSEQTAKEMTKLDLNATSFHRKFDGTLKRIDFGFNRKDKNKKKIRKVNDLLAYGGIDEFIDNEDIDEEDLRSDSGSDSDSSSSDDDTDNESVSSSSSEESPKYKRKGSKRDKEREDDLPPSLRLRNAIKNKQEERKKGTRKENTNAEY